MTAGFCEAHLDAEHAALAGRLIDKLARKRNVPFLRGTVKLWAAGAVYALAQINFLFDEQAPLHTSPGEIIAFFDVAKRSAGTKAKAIRDLLKLRPFDPEFSSEHLQAHDPFKDLVSVNGFIVPLRLLESEGNGGED